MVLGVELAQQNCAVKVRVPPFHLSHIPDSSQNRGIDFTFKLTLVITK